MPKFKFHVGQEFSSTYIAEGDTALDAWANLVYNDDAECVEQFPGAITTTLSESGVEILDETTGDWEDIST